MTSEAGPTVSQQSASYAAPIGELGTDQRRRRAPCEFVEVAHQVAVIDVPGRGRDCADARRVVPRQQLHGPGEPQDTCGGLGGKPDVVAEAGNEMASAPADLFGQHAHRHLAVGGSQVSSGTGWTEGVQSSCVDEAPRTGPGRAPGSPAFGVGQAKPDSGSTAPLARKRKANT